MHKDKLPGWLFAICAFQLLNFFTLQTIAQKANDSSKLDVLHYSARIEPDIVNGTILGTVAIRFQVNQGGQYGVELDCGSLTVDSVYAVNGPIPFAVMNGQLHLEMEDSIKVNQTYEVEISYHGKPPNGIRFFPDLRQVYTVFFTRQWLICNDTPLVFRDWSQPTTDDRVLVYYNGAYVLHLLREELGEEKFREAIRIYSQMYFGKSVVSANFQQVLEETSGRNMDVFFAKWVY